MEEEEDLHQEVAVGVACCLLRLPQGLPAAAEWPAVRVAVKDAGLVCFI